MGLIDMPAPDILTLFTRVVMIISVFMSFVYIPGRWVSWMGAFFVGLNLYGTLSPPGTFNRPPDSWEDLAAEWALIVFALAYLRLLRSFEQYKRSHPVLEES